MRISALKKDVLLVRVIKVVAMATKRVVPRMDLLPSSLCVQGDGGFFIKFLILNWRKTC